MAGGKFKCSKCDRSFTMAAHLARHTSSMHGQKAAKAATPVKTARRMARRATPVRSAPMSGGAGSLVGQMRTYQAALLSQRSSLESQIAGIEAAIGALGGISSSGRPAFKRGPGRPRTIGVTTPRPMSAPKIGRPMGSRARAGSLKENIVKVLRQAGKGLTVQEIASSVKASGYTTKSANLSKAVSNALPGLKIVRRVGRGVYRA